MYTTTEKTVGEIARENPSSVRVFDSLRIDYCCGGNHSLSEACLRVGADVNRVLELLEKAERDSQREQPDGWNQKRLADLIFHIVEKHHAFVRQESPRIEALLSRVVNRHGSAHPELAEIERLFMAIDQELSTHMMKEEQVLFPYIARMEQAVVNGAAMPAACFESVARPISNMVAEHDDAGALVAQIRQLSNGFTPPHDACPTFIALYHALEEFERDLHHHVHLENNILFPRAIEMERAH